MGRSGGRAIAAAALALAAALPGTGQALDAPPGEPLSVAVSVQPASAPAGTPVEVTVTVRDPEQSQHIVRVDFGDTTGYEVRFFGECADGGRGTDLDAKYKIPHKYRSGGAYAVVATVFTGGCDDAGDPPVGSGAEAAAASAPVLITPAATPSNGEEQPRSHVVSSFRARVGKPVQMEFEGSDQDGFVRTMQVTDPTGKVRTFTRSDACVDPLMTWPRGSWSTEPFEQKFDKPGRYGFRVRTVSTGCDGRSRQVHTTTHWTVVTG